MITIFDKDGTLVIPASGELFVQEPTDQIPLAGAKEAVEALFVKGHRLAIASNQGGVELGKKTKESAIQEMRYCLELFPHIECGVIAHTYGGNAISVTLAGHKEIVPTHGNFRKPGPGMLNHLISLLGGTPGKTWFIGDRPEDAEASENAGCLFLAADILRSRYAKRGGSYIV